MSDTVLVTLITSAFGLATTVLGVINNFMMRKQSKDIGETKNAMAQVEKASNGMTEKLVQATAEAERAKGYLQGRAAADKRQDERLG